ncbi:MAG: leucine-rich repeat protein [Paludibacteraceae bacterium]|nr:leucine-rich repeat protein [Paludibacteraceae bacterium]
MSEIKGLFLYLFVLIFSQNIFSENRSQNDSTLNLSVESEDLDIYGIDEGQYMGRDDIKNIVFHDSLLTIGMSAFKKCQNLTDLRIPKRCEDILDSAFLGCESLRTIKWPDSLKSIGKSAFRGCINLTDLVIPKGCKYILDDAFDGCDSLKTVEIPASVTYIGLWAIPVDAKMIVAKRSAAEQYARKFGITYSYGRGQKEIVDFIQEKGSLTLDLTKENDHVDIYMVGNLKYWGRDDIKEIKFSDSLFSIGAGAFSGCRNLEKVKIPNKCKEIEHGAFIGCTSLQSVEIPASVTTIGQEAFPLDATLIVDRGSFAERYARTNGIDFVYKNGVGGPQIKNAIRPILKTQWDQPLSYFYGKRGKYGYYKWNSSDGICYIIAYAQILNHLGLNVYGSHRYTTDKNVYYGDFDKDKVDMNKLPAYSGYNKSANAEFYKYIENIALASEHGWRKEHVLSKMSDSKSKHIPAKFECHYMKEEGKMGLEKIIRENLKNNIPLYAGLRKGHAVVIDGIREKNGKTEVHMNFGWGGDSNRWTTLQSPIIIKDYMGEVYCKFTDVEYIVEVTPLSKKELKEWKPLRMDK